MQRIGPQNYYVVSFPQGIIWGVMGCAAGFGISLVSERSGGTLVRLRMAPIGTTQILAGKALACLLAVVSVSVILLAVAVVAFHVRPVSYVMLAAAVACVALAFVGVMMLLAVLGKTERAAGGIGWAILTTMAMIGGGMLPLFFMPQWLQTFSSISPVKWAILALEGAIWRGFTPVEMLKPCGRAAGGGDGVLRDWGADVFVGAAELMHLRTEALLKCSGTKWPLGTGLAFPAGFQRRRYGLTPRC